MTEPKTALEYRIVVQGRIDESWSEWLGGMSLRHARDAAGEPVTTLTGLVEDQSALRGLLARIWNLNLSVVEVRRIAPPRLDDPGPPDSRPEDCVENKNPEGGA